MEHTISGLAVNSQVKGKRFAHRLYKNRILLLMILPAVLYYILFNYVPMMGVILAFKKFTYDKGFFGSPWVGFDNFRFLVNSGSLFRITRNTILYNLAFIGVGVFLQVSCAIILSELSSKAFKKISQTVMFLPYFVSYVLLGAFVYNIFNYEFGSLNTLLKSVGMEPVDVYGQKWIWKYILVIFHEWKGVGYGTVIYLAAIMGIGSEYYEAAKIDGAGFFQQIRFITLPLLRPTIIIILMFSISKILRGQFELFYQIIGDNGQLFEQTEIIDTYVFRSLTKFFDVGMGAAVSLYQSFFGFLLVVTVNYIIKKMDEENALF